MLYRAAPTDQHRRGWDEVGQKEGRNKKRSRRRSSPHTTESAESAVIDRRRKLGKVGVEDEDKESMDEGNSVRYLRMN
jgi:hypothetical protein